MADNLGLNPQYWSGIDTTGYDKNLSAGMNWANNNFGLDAQSTKNKYYGNIIDFMGKQPSSTEIDGAMSQYGVSAKDIADAYAWKASQNQPAAPASSGNTFYDNNKGLTAPVVDEYKKNPYLDEMAKGITDQMNQNWERNVNPSLRSGAMAAGGFGGSRQGVVEANALNDMNRSLGQNLTNLYGTDYTNDRNRALQKYGMDQGYNLGMANNNLGYANLDANIYNSNFNNQLNSAQFGLQAFNTLNGLGQQNINNATNIQNTPLQYNSYFGNQYNAAGGLGTTGTQTQGTTSNPWMTGATAVRALGY